MDSGFAFREAYEIIYPCEINGKCADPCFHSFPLTRSTDYIIFHFKLIWKKILLSLGNHRRVIFGWSLESFKKAFARYFLPCSRPERSLGSKEALGLLINGQVIWAIRIWLWEIIQEDNLSEITFLFFVFPHPTRGNVNWLTDSDWFTWNQRRQRGTS